MNFLQTLFLVGVITATLQDIKRREIDNWLNLLIFATGITYITFDILLNNALSQLIPLLILIGVMIAISHLFYYGKVFAGGDAKLLLALTPLFFATTTKQSLLQAGTYILLLLLAGSIYGLIYSTYLSTKHWKNIRKEMKKQIMGQKQNYYFLAILCAIGGIFSAYFFILAGLFAILPTAYSYARAIEQVCMIRTIPGKNLREGDWLVEDIQIGKKIIPATWDGLTKEQIKKLQKKKEVTIREGIPFAPAFLLATILYLFFLDKLFFIGKYL